MNLVDANGRQAQRLLEISQLERENEGDLTLLVIKGPKQVRGTALLSHANKNEPDDQWLFLPAVNRVKKIASRNKSGPFLGSAFAYEDLVSQEVEKFDYRLVSEQTDAYVVERIPRDKYSGYSKQIVWYDSNNYLPIQILYFDQQGRELKTLKLMKYQKHDGRFWKSHHMIMTNSQTGRATELIWSQVELISNFSREKDFSIPALRRTR